MNNEVNIIVYDVKNLLLNLEYQKLLDYFFRSILIWRFIILRLGMFNNWRIGLTPFLRKNSFKRFIFPIWITIGFLLIVLTAIPNIIYPSLRWWSNSSPSFSRWLHNYFFDFDIDK